MWISLQSVEKKNLQYKKEQIMIDINVLALQILFSTPSYV